MCSHISAGYLAYQHTIEFLKIRTPPFFGKDAYCNLFLATRKMKLLNNSCTAKPKHDEMAFLTSRNASEHILLFFMLIVQPGMPWSRNSQGFRPSLAGYTLRSVTCETSKCDVLHEGQRVALQKLEACLSYRYTFVDRSYGSYVPECR